MYIVSTRKKPWYKRKSKNKTKNKKSKTMPVEPAYEYWRPEIQVNEGIVSVNQDPSLGHDNSGTMVKNKIS